jgi:DNA modification methylase
MSVRVIHGDCREVLASLPADSVHCVVTSPPYWGLRDYNIGKDAFGLEPTIDLYVRNAVEIFRAVHRVLRPDGTLWLNLGDSYATGTAGARKPTQTGKHGYWENPAISHRINGDADGLKPKDLCGIPWRVAFALQADGWWLRQDIIWAKPNPMPESVTDRCTKAHEYLFLLTKSARYFYDAEAIKEPVTQSTIDRVSQPTLADQRGSFRVPGKTNGPMKAVDHGSTRNKRSVWEIATQPFSEAHFATFPPELIEPCIKAGTSERGCCAKCGAPWRRVIAKKFVPQQDVGEQRGVRGAEDQKPMDESNRWEGFPRGSTSTATLRWQPTCKCDAASVPCTVLDPFGGAGTAGLVADRLQRNAILVELNPDYVAVAERRIRNDAPLFATAATTV